MRSKGFPCKWCGEDIYLDDQVVSKNGKKIPLEERTDEPHDCPERPDKEQKAAEKAVVAKMDESSQSAWIIRRFDIIEQRLKKLEGTA